MSAAVEPFGQLLREKMSELEVDEAAQEAMLTDPVELLRMAVSRELLTSHNAPFPRQGAQAYSESPDSLTEEKHKLDVIF